MKCIPPVEASLLAKTIYQALQKYRLTKENDRSTVSHMNEINSNDTRDIILDVTEKLIYKSGIAATGMDLPVSYTHLTLPTTPYV